MKHLLITAMAVTSLAAAASAAPSPTILKGREFLAQSKVSL